MTVSNCCHAEISGDIMLEYPNGGRRFAIPYKVERCKCCLKEIEESEEHDDEISLYYAY